MKATDYIAFTIDRLPKGYVFTYSDFTSEVKSKEAIIKALNRMVGAGKIAKLAKGKYYKPEVTVFGNLGPDQYQIVKDLLEDGNKITGYLTGYSIFPQLGLTTQVSNTIQIGKNQSRPSLKRDRFTIFFVKQKNTISKENIPLLQILDSIRYYKKIPDSSISVIYKRFMAILKSLSDEQKQALVRLTLKYPPFTRAFLGAMLEEIGNLNILEPLKKSLNTISGYKIEGLEKILLTAKNWNIK